MIYPRPGRVLITGASGLIGRYLVSELLRNGYSVTAAVRRPFNFPSGVQIQQVSDCANTSEWEAALEGVSVVVHCLARVHVTHESESDPIGAYRRVNVDGSIALGEAAAKLGVRRLIYLSSVKALAEQSQIGKPLTACDSPAPTDPYGLSKLEAERALAEIAVRGKIELVVIRPPLVYGRGVRAHFQTLARWIARGLPLPLGCITENRRSLVAIENLVDLIRVCLDHSNAAGEIFHVSDGEDLSTAELVHRIAETINRPVRMVNIPAVWLSRMFSAIGKAEFWTRLGGTLQVDINHTREKLSWIPPVSVNKGLELALSGYREQGELRD